MLSANSDAVGFSSAHQVPVKIRKEFPETWLWDTTDDNGLVIS